MARRRRKWLWLLGGVVGLLVLTVLAGYGWLLAAGWADLRSDQVRARAEDAELASRGRELLERTAQRHGYDVWRRHRTQTVTAVDHWSNQGPWWPANPQRFRADRLLGTFTSRVELLDGPAAGEVWGIQSWLPYKRATADAEPIRNDIPALEFYLPTLQYFDELPFRLLSAPIVLHAGEGLYGGTSHERVFVTWGSPEAHREHDQYELWIDAESGLIDVVRYTVREAAALSRPWMRPLMRTFGAGTIHYQDYREASGVLIPFVQTVTLPPPGDSGAPTDGNWFHRLEVEGVEFDRVAPEALVIDARRPVGEDRKPTAEASAG